MDNRERTKLIIKRYRSTIWTPFIRALKEFSLVEEGDVVAIGLSGGKDSIILSYLLEELKRHSKTKFDIKYISLDVEYENDDVGAIEKLAQEMDIDINLYKTGLFDAVRNSGVKSPCFLCARMRRGFLYEKALEQGANKLALGHHMDDVVETIMMNVLYQGKFMTMMPKIKSSNFKDISLIRPMYYIEESAIIKWMSASGLEAVGKNCPLKPEDDGTRIKMKKMIRDLNVENSLIKKSIQQSAHNVCGDAVIRINGLNNIEDKFKQK